MTTGTNTRDRDGAESLASQLGLNRLGEQLQGLASAMADRGVSVVTDRLDGLTDKMSGTTGKTVKNMAKGDSAPKAALKAGIDTVKDSGVKGASTIKDKVSEAVGGDSGGDSGKDKKLKFINIVEELDLPVPRAVAYQAWTQFEEFPTFMKKVENVEQQEDQTVEWKAQIFWSHRSWTAEIIDQVPNERIVWRSKGEKGHVDGAVTFHELTPDLTRMLINLEYYPQGLFERTGNLWRAQGRRVRLELKFFRRYITSDVMLRQDEVEGWPGEIHDGEVTEEGDGEVTQEADGEVTEEADGEVTEEASDSKDQGSERRSESAPAAKSSAKKPAPTAATSSRPRPAAKKASSSESSPSRARPAAKKASSSESSPSRARAAAKKSSSSSASSRRGTTAKKSTTSSSRSRS
jgi:uncharacterized membrane protein